MRKTGISRDVERLLPPWATLSLFAAFAAPAEAQGNPGDSVFAGLQYHVVNIKFSQPWSVVEPILKANKEAEIYIPARVEINCIPAGNPGCHVFDSVGVRHKGNSTFSASRAKNPFRVSFDEYGIDQRWDGLKGFTLNNAWSDPSHMNEKIHLDFARKAGIPAPRANFAWLYINDAKYSFYSLVELADKRLLESRFGDKDGDLFKARDLVGGGQPSDFKRYSPYTAAAYQSRYENKSDSLNRAWNRLVRFVDTLNLASDGNLPGALPRIAAVNDLYRAFGTDILFSSSDSYMQSGQNFLFYFPGNGGPMRWIVWDVSLSMGSSTTMSLTNAGATSGSPPSPSRPLIYRIMNTPALKADYLRALWFLYNAHFAGNWLHQRIDSVATFIRPHLTEDTRKLSTISAFETDIGTLKSFVTSRQTYAQGSGGFSATANGPVNATNAIRNGDARINEIAPAQGWVEVHNARNYAIDLSGHSLSDNPAQPNKWSFPLNTFVEPGGHRVIALQGGTAGSSGPVNFTLPASGGHLRLSRANGTVVDSATFGAQSGTRTFSRLADGTGSFGQGVPTPGLPNVDASGLPASIPPLTVVINELMADNDTLTAPAGVKADWVELFNTTSSAVSLAGMHLSDNANNPAKWTFPSGASIPANGYLVVWAYDTTYPGSLHAAWALSKDGEHVRLSNADLSVVDSVTFGLQAKNRSLARVPNGTGPWVGSRLPTLGAHNGNSVSLRAGIPDAASRGLELGYAGTGRMAARFTLAVAGPVRLSVHDARGREIAVLANGPWAAGKHTRVFDAGFLPAGTYWFRLRAQGAEHVRAGVITR